MKIRCPGCKGTIVVRKGTEAAVLAVHDMTCPKPPTEQHQRRGARREREECLA